MKVYKFFKIPSEYEKDDIDIERKYVLYALTNKKEYADRFKEDRNMKKFICKVHKHVDSDEYTAICNNDRGAVLELHQLTTVFDENHTSRNSHKKEVLMTYWENQMIIDANIALDDESLWRSMPYPLIFKQKYKKMLDALQYTNYYKLMTAEYLPFDLSQSLAESDDDLDYSAPSLMHDELAIFIDLVRDTL